MTSQDRETIGKGAVFSPDSGTSAADFASFFLFWLISLPALWFPVHKIRHLFTVKSYTNNLRDKITTLDASVSQVGRGLVEKKRALLQAKKTSANLDEAIDNLQAGLRVLDVVNRIGEMMQEGKYWSALRVNTLAIICAV